MIGLIVLAEPIVALLYQRGHFTDVDTQATAAALRFYAPGLIGYSIVRIASPTFYSLGNARTPVIVSVASVSVNLILNILLVRVMEFRGLALGTAIAALFNALTLLWLLRGRLQGIDGRRITVAFIKISGAAVVMGIVAALVAARLDATLPGSGELVRALRVSIAITTALVALVVSARLLRIEEFTDATDRVLRRVLPARR
jgi:putative peptidoglycan lipid II flippase